LWASCNPLISTISKSSNILFKKSTSK
jgi:hypothetical protein